MVETPRDALGFHTEALIADVLDKREESVITATVAKLTSGELSQTFALQQWIAIAEGRRLRSALVRRAKAHNTQQPQSL